MIPPALGERSSVNFGPLITEIKQWNRTHPNWLFRKTISAPKRCCIPKFLHPVENDQVLLVHPHQGWGSPLQFFSKGVQNWLKIWYIRACSFWGRGSTPMKLCHTTGHRVGMITYVQILGAAPAEIWEGQKVENSAWFWTTFDFDRKYLKNQSRYQNWGTNLINDNFNGI